MAAFIQLNPARSDFSDGTQRVTDGDYGPSHTRER